MPAARDGMYSSTQAQNLLQTESQVALSVASGSSTATSVFESAKLAKELGFASARSGILVLANTVLGGSGLLGMPSALAKSGYALGMLFMVFFAFCSAFGCHLLQCSARRIGQAPCSFYSVSNAVAPRWTWLIDSAVMVKCFGVATSYLIIVGDLAPPALVFFGFRQFHRWEVILIGFAVAGSLACCRNLSGLKFTAAGSLLIVTWTVVLIILFVIQPSKTFQPCGHQELPCGDAEVKAVDLSDPLALGKALPVFIFGFTCQQNIFAVCNEVRNTTCRRVDGIIAAALFISFIFVSLASVLGYLTFGDNICSDVLKGYPSSSVVAVTRLLYSLLALLSYPLQIHPSRASALALMDLVRPTGGAHRWAAVTLLELIGSLLIAITVMDLGKVLGVVGATGSTMVSYILPGIVYVQTFRTFHAKRLLALGQLLLGCIIMPVCLVLLFL
ncbi:unnamed protein product [Cladocopium goreaui]|uniref:Amino acid transporter transmembrane domain-containing protein n=1 Tax=Cladocopium goreaui TaxID=2562237 RepID=A0A9P1GG76_9DINO|nr:unnamed protein product [Cladocopium goreaui]